MKKVKKTSKKKSVKKAVKKKKTAKKVVRKKKKIERVKTGVSGLDKLIQGGFISGSVNTVVGGSGSGKTILAIQFIMEGIRKGESGLYITFEEKKDNFYKNMIKFGWDLQKLEDAGKFMFLEYSPEKVKLMLEEGGGDIENIILKKKITRIAIDSITSFSMLFKDKISKRSSVIGLFDMFRRWNCTVLATAQSNPVVRKSHDPSPIEFEADGIILMYFTRMKNTRERYLEVLKMRSTKHPNKIYPFEIKKKGISVSGRPAKVSF